MPEPTVMLVDDHDLFRAGLRTLLEKEGLSVVAECTSGRACIATAQQHRPSVALVDVSVDSGEGIEVARELAEHAPGTAAVMLTLSDSDVDVYQSMRAGARGYALKPTPIPDLAAGIRAVAAGGAYLSPSIAAAVVGFVATGSVPRIGNSDMSDRELEVLRLMARGLDNNQIAAELSISAKTVKNHVSSIFSKLGMNNRVQAAVYAVRSGLA